MIKACTLTVVLLLARGLTATTCLIKGASEVPKRLEPAVTSFCSHALAPTKSTGTAVPYFLTAYHSIDRELSSFCSCVLGHSATASQATSTSSQTAVSHTTFSSSTTRISSSSQSTATHTTSRISATKTSISSQSQTSHTSLSSTSTMGRYSPSQSWGSHISTTSSATTSPSCPGVSVLTISVTQSHCTQTTPTVTASRSIVTDTITSSESASGVTVTTTASTCAYAVNTSKAVSTTTVTITGSASASTVTVSATTITATMTITASASTITLSLPAVTITVTAAASTTSTTSSSATSSSTIQTGPATCTQAASPSGSCAYAADYNSGTTPQLWAGAAASLEACAILCDGEPGCLSLAYNPSATLQCVLFNNKVSGLTTTANPGSSLIFYDSTCFACSGAAPRPPTDDNCTPALQPPSGATCNFNGLSAGLEIFTISATGNTASSLGVCTQQCLVLSACQSLSFDGTNCALYSQTTTQLELEGLFFPVNPGVAGSIALYDRGCYVCPPPGCVCPSSPATKRDLVRREAGVQRRETGVELREAELERKVLMVTERERG